MPLKTARASETVVREVEVGSLRLAGSLAIPAVPSGLVIFVHGSGSSRFSPRNRQVAQGLNGQGMATLLFDVLRPEEEAAGHRALVFDIPFLAKRLCDAVRWADGFWPAQPIGLFGASTGAAAALVAAAELGSRVGAIVSRGGRPDLAANALARVKAPTLLIVGGADHDVLLLNRYARRLHQGLCSLEIVAGATHLFEEPGMLEKVTQLAAAWFERYLCNAPT